MPRVPHPDRPGSAGEAGFTLLEVLAAVAVAALILSAVAGVVAVTFAGARSAAERLSLAAVARTLLATLPQGEALQVGTSVGTLGDARWRIDVSAMAPIPPAPPALAHAPAAPGAAAAAPPPAEAPNPAGPANPAGAPPAAHWQPASIVIVATARSGRSLRLETVGLLRRAAP